MKTNLNILLVEDEIITALLLKKEIRNIGYVINTNVTSGEKAIDSVLKNPPDLILMDIGLAGKIDGIDTMKQIKLTLDIPVIFMTGYSDTVTKNRAQIEKPLGYLDKPVDLQALKHLIDHSF